MMDDGAPILESWLRQRLLSLSSFCTLLLFLHIYNTRNNLFIYGHANLISIYSINCARVLIISCWSAIRMLWISTYIFVSWLQMAVYPVNLSIDTEFGHWRILSCKSHAIFCHEELSKWAIKTLYLVFCPPSNALNRITLTKFALRMLYRRIRNP